tara:strand:- start:7136 stop:7279 length:144 start_codon:yes stop_codon:yes gene_type:complete
MKGEVELWECGTCGSTGRCVHCQLIVENEDDNRDIERYQSTDSEVHI